MNYLGRLEIIHLKTSWERAVRGGELTESIHVATPGGGFGDTPNLNSLRIVVRTQSVPANPLHILQPCAVG